ncbi:MAG: hypothetical protein ACK5PB_10320 [Pirellula sp.]
MTHNIPVPCGLSLSSGTGKAVVRFTLLNIHHAIVEFLSFRVVDSAMRITKHPG